METQEPSIEEFYQLIISKFMKTQPSYTELNKKHPEVFEYLSDDRQLSKTLQKLREKLLCEFCQEAPAMGMSSCNTHQMCDECLEYAECYVCELLNRYL